MTDPFETLIQQLGASLNLSLHVDHSHACTLQIHQKLQIQIQVDAALETLWIAAFISEVPPGKFRENVLCEALKTNNLPDPRTGVLSFLSPNNRLVLHQGYPFAFVDGEKLSHYVASFIEYANLWREAIERGQTTPAPITGSTAPSLFSLNRKTVS